MRYKTVTILGILLLVSTGFFIARDDVVMLGAVTLSDDFDDNSIATADWDVYESNGTVTETGSQLEIAVTANTSGAEASLNSDNTYDFDETSAYINLIQTASPGVDNSFWLQSDYGDRIMWVCSSGTCYTHIQDGYAAQCGGTYCSSETITPGTDTWLRIREASGTTYWDYSTDNQDNWTNSHSETTTSLPVTESAMSVWIQAYEWSGTGATTENTFIVDNFNSTPETSATTDVQSEFFF